MTRLPLRIRLAVSCALVLAGALLGSGALLYGAVRFELLRHHDDDLREAAAIAAQIVSEGEDCADLTASQRTRLDAIGRVILFHEVDDQTRVFYHSADAPDLSALSGAGQATNGTPGSGWFETDLDGPTPRRVYSQQYQARSGRRGVIHVAENMGDVVAPLGSLVRGLLLLAPLAALVSALGGYWLAGTALAPVERATSLAREIGASNLSRRLPVPGARDEIGRLVDTLNQMIGRLESAFEGMRRFTADASHELRGPLSRLRGHIDVTLARQRSPAEYRDVLTELGEDVDRLRSIVEDLLLLARVDGGRVRMDLEPVRLDVLAAEVAESFLPACHEQGVSLTALCPQAVLVEGDERWLRQLLANLLDNAVKFSRRAGGAVRLEALAQDGTAILRVTDSGPGIPPSDLGRIFERFYRADAARPHGDAEGTGLGLAIVAWIVEAHSGTITAENTAQGTLFTVSMALASDGTSPARNSRPN